MSEEDHDDDERREAEALAHALDRGSATDDLPEEALQTAALIRYSSDEGLLSEEREGALLADVLAAAERAAKQREVRAERAPSPWWRWIAAFAGVSAIAVVIAIVFAGRLRTVEATELPAPNASLLSAQMERQEGGSDDRFEAEMSAYRADVYAALGERYGAR